MAGWHQNPRVDRYLKDKAMDHIDHALGRHLDPLGETFRNYFAAGGKLADEMAANPHWNERGKSGDLRFFSVTMDGREALSKYLKSIPDPNRAYSIVFEDHTMIVAAASAGKAKYRWWLEISDCLPDLTFVEFCRNCNIRRVY